MAQTISLMGATYPDVPSVKLPKSGGGTAQFDDTTDADAQASDIAQGKTAYVNGTKVVGTSSGGGGGELTLGAIRPDAELVDVWTYDKMLVADEQVALPSYSTSAQTLKTTQTINYTTDTNYDYLLVYRWIATPQYNSTTIVKGKNEYSFGTVGYELVYVPAYSIKTLDGSKSYASPSRISVSYTSQIKTLYWSSTSAVSVASSSYGAYCSFTTPQPSSATLVLIRTPSFAIRGSGSYMSSDAWSMMTDIRYQYRMEMWRAKKGNSNLDGWFSFQEQMHLIDNINNNGGTLT